jgi:thioredoxin reductase (NADPH)
MKKYDALVIGGGPAGTTAAFYLLRSGISLAWAEKLSPGGQMLLTGWIENYPTAED